MKAISLALQIYLLFLLEILTDSIIRIFFHNFINFLFTDKIMMKGYESDQENTSPGNSLMFVSSFVVL